ncbi:MAG: hypothetical protein U5Q44_08820 [Dehalococcoidia bacterium]|nr:hypothetical protein [Dehalococcoidia bacterium]
MTGSWRADFAVFAEDAEVIAYWGPDGADMLALEGVARGLHAMLG